MSKPTRYTPELLTQMAQRATSLDEMLALLGREPNHDRRKYLRGRLTALGIDTGHFTPTGSIYTRELLAAAVAECTSVAGVVRYLRLRQAGGTQAHIGRRIKHFGIDTSHFTGQAHSKGKQLPTRLRPDEVLVQRPRDAKRLPGSRIRQALAELGRPERCGDCGTGAEWQGRPLTLEVDHINGDWSDNRPANLRLLCPNCHAITPTYCRPKKVDARTGTRQVA
ncbi:HNH endonuclease signature motif containing protein [Kitasatospora viridis]|uniref:HNH endonuclease n=1 Tax=Kitasatospora viridis TaxID=281105 RepID=A0A561UKB9_9ACTN|nr:HNH endonuclease signature motif containing protein [Kitasatospora viridis]TWF99809.1 HNH endonuclease [Kitasatospora viridis]